MRIAYENREHVTGEHLAAWARRASVRTILAEMHWAGTVPGAVDAVEGALRDRDAIVRREYVDEVFREWWAPWTAPEAQVALRLIRAGLAETSQPSYLRHQMSRASGWRSSTDDQEERPGDDAADFARFLERDLWLMFRVEGAARGRNEHWFAAFVRQHPEIRDRVLDASLDVFLHDFSSGAITLFLAVHPALEPTLDEIVARERRYVAVLSVGRPAAIRLAQDHLARVFHRIVDLPALLGASRIVLARREKTSVVAHARFLAALAATRPESLPAIQAAASESIAGQPADLVERVDRILSMRAARRTIVRRDATRRADAGGAVVVPAPRDLPLPPRPETPPILDVDELGHLLVELLERDSTGDELWRAVDAVLRMPRERPSAASALSSRVRRLLSPKRFDRLDDRLPLAREHVAMLVGAWLGVRHEFDPPGIGVRDPTVAMPWLSSPDRFGWATLELPTPRRVCSAWMIDVAAAVSGDGLAPLHEDIRRLRVAPVTPARWERRLLEQPILDIRGSWSAVPAGLHVLWFDANEPPATEDTIWAAFFDLRLLEYGWVASAAQIQDGIGEPAVLAFTNAVFAADIDRFAAHAIPALSAAVEFPHAETTAVTDALGNARRPLGPPAETAIALALSARDRSARSRAAEAFAAACATGLLHPTSFGQRLGQELSDGIVKSARVAESLADAATISEIAGWRVLESLVAVLPAVPGVHGRGALLQLTARLADEYGMAVDVPTTLQPAQGSGPSAVAIRSLATSMPCATDRARAAAAQARAALDA